MTTTLSTSSYGCLPLWPQAKIPNETLIQIGLLQFCLKWEYKVEYQTQILAKKNEIGFIRIQMLYDHVQVLQRFRWHFSIPIYSCMHP
jgi:hypothetical protein